MVVLAEAAKQAIAIVAVEVKADLLPCPRKLPLVYNHLKPVKVVVEVSELWMALVMMMHPIY